jgi:hemoglobin-like flavoprotein
MRMTSRQVQLVQETFKLVVPSAESFVFLFYNHLFSLDPALRFLFGNDLKAHAKKFMITMALIINDLSNLEQTLPAVRYLGQRHVGYGVQPEDYQMVGQALLWALAEKLGDAFSKEVEEAWAAAYCILAAIMQNGSIEAEAHSGLSYQNRDGRGV